MKKEYNKNLRYCEKIKEDEYFLQVDGLQKKIRDKIKTDSSNFVDAEIQMRQIECFWKKGWEYDRVHHTYIEPDVTIPQIYIQNPRDADPSLEHYYELLTKFVHKLKIEHEDQTNYRMDLIHSLYQGKKDILHQSPVDITSKMSFEHLLSVLARVMQKMLSSLEISKNKAQDLMQEYVQGYTCKGPVEFFYKVCNKVLNSNESENQQSNQYNVIKIQAIKFISLITQMLLEVQDSQKRQSRIIAIQPLIGQLTFLLHPMLFALYSLFSHQEVIKEAKKKRGKVSAELLENKPLPIDHQALKYSDDELLHIKDDFKKQEHRHSKIIFINLDGYESQFNLEFARNFSDHLMYVSFPKYGSSREDESYNRRFHKKIMFNVSRPECDLFQDEQDPTQQRQKIKFDPEDYYQNIEAMYEEVKATQKQPDTNKNVYIFPVKMDSLSSSKAPSDMNRDIEAYESYFLKFLMRDNLYSQMVGFKANSIVVSYSGRINIESQHFVQLVQQLTKICRKVILFPNFTASLTRQKMQTSYQVHRIPPFYTSIGRNVTCPQIPSNDLQFKLAKWYRDELGSNPCEVDLMDKMAVFLKISSGNYNLNRAYEEETFQGKYSNCQIFDYVIHLFEALKYEYEHCQKRIRRSSLQVSKQLMQRDLQRHRQELSKHLPPYYHDIFSEIQKLLKYRQACFEHNYSKYQAYELLLEELQEKIKRQYMGEEHLLRMWEQFRKKEQLIIVKDKYHEESYIEIIKEPMKNVFRTIDSEKMDNMDNIFKIAFFHQQTKELVKIYKETSLHYSTYQRYKNNKRPEFNLVLTNVLNEKGNDYEDYATRPKLSSVRRQKCTITRIAFCGKQGEIQRENRFSLWTQWNYAQTQNYLILYWPQQFDHMSYFLHKMLNKKYEAPLTNHVFICHKEHDFIERGERVNFHLLTLPAQLEVIPRWGCSVWFIDDQMFIFGGFHDRQRSYLELQNQITTLDLTDFKPSSYQPRKLFNLRKQLYSGQTFMGHLREGRKPSSFVRPRMQFEFYDYDDLNLYPQNNVMQEENQQQIKKIAMIGGFGQNFKTPHAILVNYYYLIRYHIPSRRILSIHKKLLYGKVIPINVKEPIKNRGLFHRHNILSQEGDDKERVLKQGITHNNHYFAHKVIYAMEGDQLKSKVKDFYALELYNKSSLEDLMGQTRAVEEPQRIIVSAVEDSKHEVMIQVDSMPYRYSLSLEKRTEDKIEVIQLSHQSVIAIDTKQEMIYALVCHPTHTKNQTYLTRTTFVKPDSSILQHQQSYTLTLKRVAAFPESLNLHCLILGNTQEVIIVQGLAFAGNVHPQICLKIKSKDDIRREQIKPHTMSSEEVNSITSFFFKKNNIVTSINFLKFQDNETEVAIVREKLDLREFSKGWKEIDSTKRFSFTFEGHALVISSYELRIEHLNSNNIIVKVGTMGSRTKKQQFWTKLSELLQGNREVPVFEISSKDEETINGMHKMQVNVKTQDKYNDYNYFG